MTDIIILDPLNGKSYVLLPTTKETNLAVITTDEGTDCVEHTLVVLQSPVHHKMESEVKKHYLYELDTAGNVPIVQDDWFFNKPCKQISKHTGADIIAIPGAAQRLKNGCGKWLYRITATTDNELNAAGVPVLGDEEINDFRLKFNKVNDFNTAFITENEVAAITAETLCDLYDKASNADKALFLELRGLTQH